MIWAGLNRHDLFAVLQNEATKIQLKFLRVISTPKKLYKACKILQKILKIKEETYQICIYKKTNNPTVENTQYNKINKYTNHKILALDAGVHLSSAAYP